MILISVLIEITVQIEQVEIINKPEHVVSLSFSISFNSNDSLWLADKCEERVDSARFELSVSLLIAVIKEILL